MTYLYTDEQNQIRDEVRRGMSGAAGAERLRALIEQPGMADSGFRTIASEMGWAGMSIPEAHGGLGMSTIDVLIVAEESGRALAGTPMLATSFAAAHALERADNQADLLTRIASGKAVVTLAFTEGSDPLPATPRVLISDDGMLRGTKAAVLGAAHADAAVVLCGDTAGQPCLALLDLSAQGVTRVPLNSIDNSRGIATLSFDQAAAAILPLNDPMLTARDCLARLALHLSAESVGGTDACIAMASEYANQRQAFGQAIGKFQAVKHAIAEMYVANELARATVLDAAVRIERGDVSAIAHVAAARLNAIEAYEKGAAAATQVHGGIGVTWEADLHLHYRRSRSITLEAGPSAFWEDRIVSTMETA